MIPIRDAVGKMIRCPCGFCGGATATVSRARDDHSRGPNAHIEWFLVQCPAMKRLYRHDTKVEVIEPAAASIPIVRPQGPTPGTD